jgi:hypothetical protein
MPHYVNQYKPILAGPGTTPDLIRLLPGDYEQTVVVEDGKSYSEMTANFSYYQAQEHYLGLTKRSFICSGGPWH